MPPRFIAKQLSNPTGLLGRIMGFLMNRHNAKMNDFAVKLLEIASIDRVLEIGFGGGVTVPKLLANAAFVGGLDRSDAMVKLALSRLAHQARSLPRCSRQVSQICASSDRSRQRLGTLSWRNANETCRGRGTDSGNAFTSERTVTDCCAFAA